MSRSFFTSESVTEGHPDKLCDQISDAVLDAIIAQDPNARVACETCATTGMVLLMGEISTKCYVDLAHIARDVILDVGYNSSEYGFDGSSCAVLTALEEQSADIALGVDHALENKAGSSSEDDDIGAGDQGMMFGFACDETPERMPLPISLAHALSRRLAEVRKTGVLPRLCPDGKSQVTIEYDDGRPVRVDTVVISSQHRADYDMDELRADIEREVIRKVIPAELMDGNTRIYVNPTGRFVIGGPKGDSGLTGRKIIVDTYGGYARHGGGCFSGKDPTKVDRSATYAARWIARNVVAAGLAKKCEVQIAYAIGVARPVSIRVDSFGTGKYTDEQLAAAVEKVFDLRPAAIIRTLDLRRPIYRQVAAYGHMGRPDLDLPWEREDRVDALLAAVK